MAVVSSIVEPPARQHIGRAQRNNGRGGSGDPLFPVAKVQRTGAGRHTGRRFP